MLAVTILVFVTLALKGGMNIYYFKYYLTEASEINFLNRIGFNGMLVLIILVFRMLSAFWDLFLFQLLYRKPVWV